MCYFKKNVVFLFLFVAINVHSQSDYQEFKKLSPPLKWWVIWHPFKAKKALKISREAQKISDSIAKTNLLDKDPSGGQVDAFRHTYWMARLHQEIGKKSALLLGKAYEKENYLTYKKRKLENGIIPDKASTDMDLFNNSIGVTLTRFKVKTSKMGLIYKIVNVILYHYEKIFGLIFRYNYFSYIRPIIISFYGITKRSYRNREYHKTQRITQKEQTIVSTKNTHVAFHKKFK